VNSAAVNTSSGDDSVSFGGLIPDGTGENAFEVRRTLMIDTGDDQDHVSSYGIIQTGTTWIRTGQGSDEIQLTDYGARNQVLFGHLQIDTGVDPDLVTLSGFQFKSLSIDTSSGQDRVYLGYESSQTIQSIGVLGLFNLSMGNGNDELRITGPGYVNEYNLNPYNEFHDRVRIDMGDGSDVVEVDIAAFNRAVTLNSGSGRDHIRLGTYFGGTIFNGPLTLETGNADKVSIGMPGFQGLTPENLLGFTDFNGPVTVRGGSPATTIDWYSDNASFNNRLRLIGAVMTEHRIDRRDLLDASRITVTNLRTATFRETTTHSFITGYKVTRDARGVTALIPIITKVNTGITLRVRAAISSDRRYVTVDLKFTKTEIGRVEKRLINTPLGPQEIELPQIVTLDVDSRVVVPDGGTVLVAQIRQTVQTLKDGITRATSRDLQVSITPRIFFGDDSFSDPLMVTLELRLLELLDFNVLSTSDWS
jgi:hypothetical protein